MTTFIGYAVYYARSAVVATTVDHLLPEGVIVLKKDIQFKVELLEKLNFNIDFMLRNPEGKQIEQLAVRLALIDQCIDQTMLLIFFENLDGPLPQVVNRLCN